MTLIGGALYVAHRVLMHRFGDSWATLIVFVPAFCAVFVIAPVQRRVSYALRRRHCHAHGHTPRQLLGCASGYLICERCSALLPGQAATPTHRPDRPPAPPPDHSRGHPPPTPPTPPPGTT